MQIKELLRQELMILNLHSRNKSDVIDEMINKLFEEGVITDKEVFKSEILKREEISSTGLEAGVAIPHAKTDVVIRPSVLFAKSSEGVDYEALDGEATHIFFMIAAPAGENNLHIDTLSSISKLMLKDGFIEELKHVNSQNEVYEIIEKYQSSSNDSKNVVMEDNYIKDRDFVVAVTACPTGIAHTYMAQEALEEAAKKIGVDIKVETNGSDGAKNVLTADDIKRAKGVIVAADKNIEMNRFNGKKLIQRPVSDGIRKPDELINNILSGNAKTFIADNSISVDDSTSEVENQKFSSKLYKDLMNGVSHMLPFVVGGGILIAISFLVERFGGSDIVLFKFLNQLGSNAFSFLIPILAGYIAMSIGDRPALMPGMVAGFMASQGAGFIGGLIGGFIAGEVIVLLKKLTKNLSKSLEGMKPMLIFPVFGLLITGFLMYFIVDPVFTVINTALNQWLENLGTTNLVLLGTLLGGMMAVDMGGPVNKAAYTFAVGVFTNTQNGAFAAAVMAGGMVPPLAIAIATTFFKNKFTEKEKQSGLTNYVLGLAFITEGAIPFAASDPKVIIPSSIVGAAVAGGLTQLWNISSPAPHGGIFIIPAMSELSKGGLFILAVLIGSIISAILIGVFKKKKA